MDEDEPARVKGATPILSRIKALPPGVPFVMTGDFNTGPESEAHTLLTTDLKDARETVANPEGPAETFHNFTGTPISGSTGSFIAASPRSISRRSPRIGGTSIRPITIRSSPTWRFRADRNADRRDVKAAGIVVDRKSTRRNSSH